MASELKPCPFCSKTMMLRSALWPSEGDADAIIHADPTDCPMLGFSDGSADGSIIEKWNCSLSNEDDFPSDGSCVRCGSVPRNANGLCNTCLDEDAERLESTRTTPVAPVSPDATGKCGELVTVKPLEWRKYRNGDAEAVTPFGEIYTAYVNGYWRITRNGKAGKFIKATGGDDVDAAKAGAQADFDANVLPLVRSQAVALLAAERAKADEYYGEAVVSYDRKLRIEELEAKLAAAEKDMATVYAWLREPDWSNRNFNLVRWADRRPTPPSFVKAYDDRERAVLERRI